MVGSHGNKYFPTKDGYLVDSNRAKKDTRLNQKRADCVLEEDLDWLSQLNKFDENGRCIQVDDVVVDGDIIEGTEAFHPAVPVQVNADDSKAVNVVASKVVNADASRGGNVRKDASKTVNADVSKGVNVDVRKVASRGVRKGAFRGERKGACRGLRKGSVHEDVNAVQVHEGVNGSQVHDGVNIVGEVAEIVYEQVTGSVNVDDFEGLSEFGGPSQVEGVTQVESSQPQHSVVPPPIRPDINNCEPKEGYHSDFDDEPEEENFPDIEEQEDDLQEEINKVMRSTSDYKEYVKTSGRVYEEEIKYVEYRHNYLRHMLDRTGVGYLSAL
ncbi:hypothetical protein C5167_004517 [Papaver somniferum]|uniref:Uncharacterized protein n=1 Tax=Papaver somniferum TaxID=3469 RepID=A0A4Y7J7T9_PAPSO|nr:uncharacterized protein LOC113274685 [Papaver somniferum]XP_026379865.1 uncharacterized protein LOC113274685 [Papaver somniferum]RZC57213.1 hypothetical protein C5167_004517 [Papaver somniferum]